MVLDENNTDIWDMFKSLPVPLKFRVWVFEADFSTFDYKNINTITYKKRGPYVYNEQRNKSYIEFGPGGYNVSYLQNKYYTFNKEESCKDCNMDDKIMTFNPVMVSFEYIHLNFITEQIFFLL